MWTFELCDLAGTTLGEIRDATSRSLTLALNRPSTASFIVRPDNAMMVPLFEDDTKLRIWDDKTLRYYGYVTSAEFGEEAGSAPTVKVNTADAAWKLSRRITGKSSGGTAHSGDKAKSARKIINEVNGEGESGVKVEAEAAYAAAGSGSYTAGPYKTALACINDLAHGIDGFDWRIDPLQGLDPQVGVFVAQPVLGSEKLACVFERGWGKKNVRSMSYVRDISTLANRAFHLPDDGVETEGAVVKVKNDAASEAHRGRFETIADAFGIDDATLREKWLEEVIRVRKNPRFVVGMTLDIDDGTGRVPRYGTDFGLGDVVQARAVVAGTTMFNGKARVYQVKFELNDVGSATVTPVLIDESGEELAA